MSAGVDPAIRLKVMTRLGLDQPLHVQYTRWLSSAVQGDFGFAYGYGEPVLSLIGSHVSTTVQLQLGALLLALIVTIPIGIISATRQYSLLDNTVTVLAVLLSSRACLPGQGLGDWGTMQYSVGTIPPSWG